jgi:hypothetical protein
MIQNTIDCWEVYESYDRDSNHVGYFTTEVLANQFINSHKNKNYFGKTRIRKNFVIFESMQDVIEYSQENLRKSGLAKLTDLEKAALGIKG